MRVYTVTRMDASDVVEALQEIAPLAQISVASDRRQLLIWADAATHEQIRAALQRIEEGDPDEQKGTLRIYQGPPEILTRAKSLLPQIAPQAQQVPDSQTDRLTVWALPHEHAAIDELLKSLQSQIEPADLKLATYTLQRASTTEAQQLLQSVVPDVQFLTSADPQPAADPGPPAGSHADQADAGRTGAGARSAAGPGERSQGLRPGQDGARHTDSPARSQADGRTLPDSRRRTKGADRARHGPTARGIEGGDR